MNAPSEPTRDESPGPVQLAGAPVEFVAAEWAIAAPLAPATDQRPIESRASALPECETSAAPPVLMLAAPFGAATMPGVADPWRSMDSPPAIVLAPSRPGPGFWMTVVWLVLFVVSQFAITAAVLIGAMIFRVLSLDDLRRFRDPDELERQLVGGNSFLIVLFIAGTLASLVTAVVVTACRFGGQMKRVLALRPVRPLHALLILLTVPPLSLIAGEAGSLVGNGLTALSSLRRTEPRLANETVPETVAEKIGSVADALDKHSQKSSEQFGTFAQNPAWLVVLIGCLFPGLGEEIYFRGFVGRGLVARYGVVAGVLITSVFFGLIHMEPRQTAGTIVLGIGFHVVYLASKSLTAAIIFHTLNNTFAFTAPMLAQSLTVPGVLDASMEFDGHAPRILFATAILAVAALGWMYYETRTRWRLPNGSQWRPGFVTAEEPPAMLGARTVATAPPAIAVVTALVGYGLFVASLVWVARLAA